MSIWEKVAIILVTVAGMEVFAWAAHKYVMHGWGWGWHRDHHESHEGAFEKNDLYAIVFAAIVVGLFVAGALWSDRLWWFAMGITVYGALYAFVHDVLVHRRTKLRWVPRNGYAKRLLQAHLLHHAVHNRDGAVSFGFLWAPDPAKLKAQLGEGARAERQPQ